MKIVVDQSSEVGFFVGSGHEFVSHFFLDEKDSSGWFVLLVGEKESEDGGSDVVGEIADDEQFFIDFRKTISEHVVIGSLWSFFVCLEDVSSGDLCRI